MSVLVVGFIFIFANALFYTVSLLILSFLVLIWMVSSNYISTLMIILIVIVYVGAMIILIGYICAVRPNMVISPSINYLNLVLAFIFFTVFLNSYLPQGSEIKQGTLLDFFFRDWGSFVFVLVALMLFLTLLIVTSQYSVPQGPFRSI